jgi:hypothetical protein
VWFLGDFNLPLLPDGAMLDVSHWFYRNLKQFDVPYGGKMSQRNPSSRLSFQGGEGVVL